MINKNIFSKKPKTIQLTNNIDYLLLYQTIRDKYQTSYLFESLALPKQQDRYYAFGFDPIYTFSARGNILSIKSKGNSQDIESSNPYTTLKELMPKIPASKTHQSGLIGYFSYESANYFEPGVNLEEHKNFPAFELGLYYDGLIYDSETAELSYYTYYLDRSNIIKELIDQMSSKISQKKITIKNIGTNMSRQKHKMIVEQTLEEIRKGNSFQVEVGFRTDYKIQGDKFLIYKQLRKTNPSPYMYYLQFGQKELFGASPELVVSLNSKRVLTTPAAGTTTRGKTKQEDQSLARDLVNDEKEKAEHSMLIDMHRNDISKVCKPGTVKISKLMHLMKFNFVQHIVSDIVGELDDNKDAFDLLASIMPCGVLTGAPKVETMKIIAKNEASPRGPYGGAVGRFSFNGDCAFAMPIRSMFCNGEDCYTQACSGIVFDSSPENEYEEVISKMKGLDQTINEVLKK